MAIKGSLKEASLPDVLQLLALGKKSGCLAVADRQNFGYIFFDQGRICYASIVNRRDRIGDLLVKNGRITPDQLTQAIRLQGERRDKKLGEILLGMGAIARDELEEYMRLQIEEAVYFLFTWTSGTFNFEAGMKPEQQDFLVTINPESLLLEGARRIDEWSLIEKKVPSFDLIFEADKLRVEGTDAELSPAQARLLALMDGNRDVHQLVEESGLVEFEVGKALFGLLTAGFIKRTGTSVAKTEPRATDARVMEHQNLGIAFYKTGMLDEAQREFRRVAELRPMETNTAFYLGLIALRQARWADAVEVLKDAQEKGGARTAVLHNLAFALEQLGRIAEAEQLYGEAASKARDDIRPMIAWGVAALKRQDSGVAQGRLARARELVGSKTPPALWYWAAMLAAAGNGEVDGALALGREAIEAYPGNAVLRNNLASLLELVGDLEGATVLLKAALVEDPTLPQVSKNLGDLAYRAGMYDEAFEAYERAAKLSPELGEDLHFKLGNIAYKRRDRERARVAWQRTLDLNPSHQLARANLDTLGGPE
jgi:Flp pilus assembly protein TadD